ncbi:hypothetical protein F6X40_09775 [Paraburkholderia sp. UCT31]|uniref:hypothetical protein n=1 Tax=Paraburkholderia sp. UCT31 TaxID=2615209 RepID=UPI001655D14A|nr:hypothetical protein [Paraburkholderia sp. UCT31]MBC8737096.1 hypothetical protein [Paraburkholderia sp. UCT31]
MVFQRLSRTLPHRQAARLPSGQIFPLHLHLTTCGISFTLAPYDITGPHKMARISNTLSRWHKIQTNIRDVAARRQAALLADVESEHLDMQTLEVLGPKMREKAQRAVSEGLATVAKLQSALFTVRRALARANVEYGVADLLSETEQVKQELASLQALVQATEGGLQFETAQEIEKKRRAAASANSAYHASSQLVTFVDEATVARLRTRVEELTLELAKKANAVSDANATKLSIELDDDIVKLVAI